VCLLDGDEMFVSDVVFLFSLYSNHITDAGAQSVAQIIEGCPRLLTLK